MKDSSVRPTGLLDPRRQQRLLAALSQRFLSSLHDHHALLETQADQSSELEKELLAVRTEKTADCRSERREMLQAWDDADEKLIGRYESFAIQNRQEQNRLTAVYRRKTAEGKEAIERKYVARCDAIQHQYDKRKDRPGQQRDREVAEIDRSLHAIDTEVAAVRELTIQRLDHLPDLPPADSSDDDLGVAVPKSVGESIEAIHHLTERCRSVAQQMHAGLASKVVDSYILPSCVAIVCVLWAILVFLFGPRPPWVTIMGGVALAVVIGFLVFFVFLWPLKKMTRQLYPAVERILQAADRSADQGRGIAARIASDSEADLLSTRNNHLAMAVRWKNEQLQQLETALEIEREHARIALIESLQTENQRFKTERHQMSETMHGKADAVAQHISVELADVDQQLNHRRQLASAQRERERTHLVRRLEHGVRGGLARIDEIQQHVRRRFPAWQQVIEQHASPADGTDFIPIGTLRVGESLRSVLEDRGADHDEQDRPLSEVRAAITEVDVPEALPVVLHRRLHSALVITAPPSSMAGAIEMAHQVLWRLLTGTPAARCKLTLIDPLGRGQNFTSFMALADHDPSLVGHRVWTSDAQINERLSELSQHVEDVLQASLRDRFQRIEDYNALAGSMAEPYRAIAAIGFPEGLNREGYKHLQALIESGLRCGVFVVLVCDQSKPWPTDMPMPHSEKVLQIDADSEGNWHLKTDGLESLPFESWESPPARLRDALVTNVGEAAVAASRVEIPLGSILKDDEAASGSTADGIEIPIGSQGANRHLDLDLGEGVRQHVLIAGKTGSGKSTLLHAIITSGAYRYTPDELQFYLLDFKKGVEFKPYADASFPHARVIGIESEREFGRSVLQRLDSELQHRGEQFRAVGVQELAEYRRSARKTMPRIMLVIDEFQELFVRDDRLAGDCAMLLDRLVRQGRSFGMHVVLSSQSLAGAYSLPRATLGQMAVRIAMQCSESDAALILADDNTAARLINRPGEAIYNDAGGLIEGNQPFQVAWLSNEAHRDLLQVIESRDAKYARSLPPAVVFEGNRPCRWTEALASAAKPVASPGAAPDLSLHGLLGEAVEIGPPVFVKLTRDTGRNLLLIAPPESRSAVVATCLASFQKSNSQLEVVYFDGNRVDDGESLNGWMAESGINFKSVKVRDAESEMVSLRDLVQSRMEAEQVWPPVVAVIDPMERFRDLRQEESFNFSLDAAGGSVSGSVALQDCLRDGPGVNVFACLVCGSAETLSRWLPRASQHDLELRVLGRMNASDSSMLIDSPIASELSAATMLLYDDADGRTRKFRQCDLPKPTEVHRWLES
ncbi:FtsK/SpoIIIE domain-containing protein [Novipirellula artificiosorum]|uniref:FtsK-like domain-containing protein n=1 Tax=Novipirellula artificiosorum TaxID=2528016 RepID=A0A5C6DEQ8_9BACT|nr:FtsK/SpoIIIE domain-containing protein [Novipirellula artificiosorum]TWU35168.1 FtsK-like domain-containing protein [Novipirellula artificiosorum]